MRLDLRPTLLFFALALLLNACVSAPKFGTTDGANQISIMAYNVENLFDTENDPDKDDDTYLPLAKKQNDAHRAKCAKIDVEFWRNDCLNVDWNEDVLKIKMERLAHVVKSINAGRGPDILILEEVENIGILNRFNKEYLGESGYVTAVLLEGKDDRGIDQAILSRLPLKGAASNYPLPLVAVPGKESRKDPALTRGLLHAVLVLPDGSPLNVFAVHFPSGDSGHPYRAQAIKFLNEKRASLPADQMSVVGGDFNINSKEEAQHSMYAGKLGSDWLVSHLIGCKGCEGTHYYSRGQSWSFLDALLFSKNLDPVSGTAPWKVDPQSITIPMESRYQTHTDGRPARFSHDSSTGVADHLPVFGIIKKR
jgi:endonuclease/exonuclease/phosphatase family metal-dependent hydrolase